MILKAENIPLVSICIPTYNRGRYLERSLLAYEKMQEFVEKKIEIVISDNASTDDTRERIEPFVRKYSNVVYHRNEKNIRDENFPLVMSLGNGVLHKLVHDNFIISQYGMSVICDAVDVYRSAKPVLFFDNGNSDRVNTPIKSVYEVEVFLSLIGYWITWSGGISLWHEECVNLAKRIEWCNLHLWQVGMICRMIHKKNYGVVIHRAFGHICEVQNKDVSYGIVKVFHDNYLHILKEFYKEGILSNKCIDFLEKDMLYGYFTKRIFYKDCNLDGNLIYGNGKCLKEEVYEAYKDKDYFSHYLFYYKRFYIMAYFIRAINFFLDVKKARYVIKNIFDKIKCIGG